MRVSIVGTSGSGKTTLARRLAEDLDLPRIELDALNWQPGWVGLSQADPAAFAERTRAATAAEAWVCDGNYSAVRDIVWARATDIVWLDYPRAVIMRRVIARSIRRATDGAELWPGTGNREDFRRWLDPEHPIRWAWDTWAKNRARYGALLTGDDAPAARVFRLTRPGEADDLARALRAV